MLSAQGLINQRTGSHKNTKESRKFSLVCLTNIYTLPRGRRGEGRCTFLSANYILLAIHAQALFPRVWQVVNSRGDQHEVLFLAWTEKWQKLTFCDQRQLRGKAFHMLSLLLQEGQGYEAGEICILVPCLLEATVQEGLYGLPESIAPWPDDHCPSYRPVVGQLRLLHYVYVPSAHRVQKTEHCEIQQYVRMTQLPPSRADFAETNFSLLV